MPDPRSTNHWVMPAILPRRFQLAQRAYLAGIAEMSPTIVTQNEPIEHAHHCERRRRQALSIAMRTKEVRRAPVSQHSFC